MTGYHSHIIRPQGYIHSECFVEIARAVDEALVTLNLYNPSGTPIIFGAHLDKNVPENSIIFNSEQVFSWDYIQTLKRHTGKIFDYSRNNIAALGERGIKAKLCPIAYMPSMKCISPSSFQDIDVLIYGSRNRRRINIHHSLLDSKINSVFASDLYGDRRDAMISRAKIILNIHYYEEAVHEIFRTSHLMANSKCVVSEVGRDTGIESALGSAILFVPYHALVDACKKLLEDEVARKSWERGALESFSKTSMVESLRNLL